MAARRQWTMVSPRRRVQTAGTRPSGWSRRRANRYLSSGIFLWRKHGVSGHKRQIFVSLSLNSHDSSEATVRYEPGAVCISLSASLYHAVEKWHPIPCPPELQVDNITPGRIGTVFFFPEKSLQTLEGKPPGWMRETAGGLLPLSAPSPSKSQDYDRKKIEARKKYDLIGAQKKAKNAARNRQAATNGT